jgi:hypothetical protein
MRFLLQSLEADRQAGWPLWFSAAFFVILFLSLGVHCLKILLEICWRHGITALVVPVFLLAFCGQVVRAGQSPHDLAPNVAAWTPVGPEGGDARSFASVPGQPSHLYLGTTNSWLYESVDAGANWHRLARLDGSGHMILDHIVVDSADPATIFVAGWKDAEGGDVG